VSVGVVSAHWAVIKQKTYGREHGWLKRGRSDLQKKIVASCPRQLAGGQPFCGRRDIAARAYMPKPRKKPLLICRGWLIGGKHACQSSTCCKTSKQHAAARPPVGWAARQSL